jgi:hypothetical protein
MENQGVCCTDWQYNFNTINNKENTHDEKTSNSKRHRTSFIFWLTHGADGHAGQRFRKQIEDIVGGCGHANWNCKRLDVRGSAHGEGQEFG